MRTAFMPLFASLAFAAGCNSFQTVDEACPDASPNEKAITDPADVEVFRRMQCFRRIAKRPRVRVDRLVQEAVELHGEYIDLHTPRAETLRTQVPGNARYTGSDVLSRLEASGFTFQANFEVLEVLTGETGTAAGQLVGAPHFDFWFDDPFIRPAFLQSVVSGAGVHEGLYTRVPPPDSIELPEDVSYLYWNIVFNTPAVAYAEEAVVYPRNGQTDAPGTYIHVSGNTSLERGRTYGYPITFTVGSGEGGLEITQASLQGPEGDVPFMVLSGDSAITASRLRNTAILVPEAPLAQGSTYQADVKIVTNQGERRARTSFTVGSPGRDIPAGLLRRAVELDEPLYEARLYTSEHLTRRQ